ncbi:MAG: ROK family protein [Actinomycetes bacterium]
MAEYLVLDVGGSSIKHALADDSYALSDKGSVPNTFRDNAEFIEAIGQLYDAVAGRVSGIAISACGELDPATGEMISGGALRFNAGTNMIERVGARCPVPVSVENDANCALLAEVHDGSLSDCTNGIVLVIGTGVGGAILINRRIYHGSHFHSGNASFSLLSLSEPFDPARTFAITNGVGGLVRTLALLRSLDRGELDGRSFFALLDAADPTALAAFDTFCSRLAAFIYNLQVILDVDAVALGGGISAQPRFIETVRAKVQGLFAAENFARLPAPEVRACTYFNDANLVGALFHHLHPAV